MYTLSIMILSYLHFKIFLKQNFKFCLAAVFLFHARPADRPGRPAPVSGHARLCMSVGRPPRSTDCKQFALGLSGSTARSTARRKLCFVFWDGRPERSTRANGSLPAELAVDQPGRPPSLLPNGSFLFCAILKSVFQTAFWQIFSGFSRTFSEKIIIK